MNVVLYLIFFPGDHLNTVNGRLQSLHSFPKAILVILTYGFSPRHFSHTIGNSYISRINQISNFITNLPWIPIRLHRYWPLTLPFFMRNCSMFTGTRSITPASTDRRGQRTLLDGEFAAAERRSNYIHP